MIAGAYKFVQEKVKYLLKVVTKMSSSVDPRNYRKIPYEEYESLGEKLRALLNGDTLYIKDFEKTTNKDVLIKLKEKTYTNSELPATISQLSYDISTPSEDKYWKTFNVGINDLSLFTIVKYKDNFNAYDHKFNIGDIVTYTNRNVKQSGVIQEVHISKTSHEYAYMVSGEIGLIPEEELDEPKNLYSN